MLFKLLIVSLDFTKLPGLAGAHYHLHPHFTSCNSEKTIPILLFFLSVLKAP
jgi:hypothetical protein